MVEKRMELQGRISGIFVLASGNSLAKRLGRALRGEPDLVMSGAANTIAEALERIPQVKPDLLLVELSPNEPVDVEAVRQLREAHLEMKLLARSGTAKSEYAEQAIEAGADGYILRSEGLQQLIQAMRDVLRGRLYVSDRVVEGE